MAEIKSTDPKASPTGYGLPTELPGLPGSGAAQPAPPDLAHLMAMLGISEVEGAGPAGSKQARRANTKGAPAHAGLGLPPVPKVPMTPQAQAAYSSLNQDWRTVMQTMPRTVAANNASGSLHAGKMPPARPGMQLTDPGAPNFDSETFTEHSMGKVRDVLKGLNIANGGALYAFMLLRLQHGDQVVSDLQTLSQLSTEMQTTASNQQIAKSKEAEKAAQKAQKKQHSLGILNKILTVVMLVVTVAFAAFTFGASLALLGVMAAMLTAFIVAGVVKGQKSGKGFDFWGGLKIAGFVGDGIMLATGVGAALAALRATIGQGSAKTLEQITKGATKAAAARGTGAATDAIAATGQRSFDLLSTAAKNRLIESVTQGAVQSAARRELFAFSFKNGMDRIAHLGGQQAAAQTAKAGKAAAPASWVANNANWIGAGTGVAMGLAQLPPAVIKYMAAMAQADSSEAMAEVKIWKSLYDRFEASYKNLQDTVQHITDMHSKSVDLVEAMLKNKHSTNLALTRNLSG